MAIKTTARRSRRARQEFLLIGWLLASCWAFATVAIAKDAATAPTNDQQASAHWAAKSAAPDTVKLYFASLPIRRKYELTVVQQAVKQDQWLLQRDKASSDNQKRVTEEKKLRDDLAMEKKIDTDPTWLPPARNISPTYVGEFGTLWPFTTVFQVVNEHEIIAAQNQLNFWVQGIDSTGMVDGAALKLDGVIIVSGTKAYTTALGVKRTIYCVEPLPLDGNIELVNADGSVYQPPRTPIAFGDTVGGKSETEKLNSAKKALVDARDAANAAFQKTGEYASLSKAVSDADARRANSEGMDRLNASQEFVAAKTQLKAAEQKAIVGDPAFQSASAAADSAQSEFDELARAYAKNPQFAAPSADNGSSTPVRNP